MAEQYKRFQLGEAVAKVTKFVGIPECGGCGKRRKALNKVDFGKPVTVLATIRHAVLNPDKVLHEKTDDSAETGEPGLQDGESAEADGRTEDPRR